jgi:hypothetical protein
MQSSTKDFDVDLWDLLKAFAIERMSPIIFVVQQQTRFSFQAWVCTKGICLYAGDGFDGTETRWPWYSLTPSSK